MSWDIAYSWTPATSHTTARIRRFIASNCAVPKWSIFQWFPLPRLISRAWKTSQRLCLPVWFISSHFPLLLLIWSPLYHLPHTEQLLKRDVFIFISCLWVFCLHVRYACPVPREARRRVSSPCDWSFRRLEATKVSAGRGAVVPLQEQGPNHWTIPPVPKAYFKKIK